MSRKKLRGSTATYRDSIQSYSCDLEELAEIYGNVGKVPERIGLIKAQEIALLARAFTILWGQETARRKKKLRPDKCQSEKEK